MYYIKIGLWIFILSIFYATGALDIFSTNPSFLLIFALTFSIMAKKFSDRITVALICGVLVSAFANSNFVLTVLLSVYGAIFVGSVFSDELAKYGYCVVIIIFFINMISEMLLGFAAEGLKIEVFFESLFYAVVNFGFSLIMYPMIKRTFCKKERYIFDEL